MPKTLTIRIDEESYEAFADRAKAENRSIANFIENAVKDYVRRQDFVDEYEMAEILADEELVKRLKKGSRDTKQRKGKMIG